MANQLVSFALIASLKVGVEGKCVRIIAVGSVDGVCTVAALKRLLLKLGATSVVIEFAQAFSVDKLSPQTWTEEVVFFVDLAVNNRDKVMTADFVRRIPTGCQILGVLDEHNAEDWSELFATVGLDFEALLIKPCSQALEGQPKSSGALLLSILGDQADEHTKALCEAAAAGDRMDFSGPVGSVVNKAMKAKIADDTRRVYLANHYASSLVPDEKVSGWVKEYEVIEANHRKVIASIDPALLADGIVLADATGLTVDMTTLLGLLYKKGRVVALAGETYDKALGRKVKSLSFGTPPGTRAKLVVKDEQGEKIVDQDILSAIKAVVPEASGFAEKANVPPEHTEAALKAAKEWLSRVPAKS